MHKIYEEKVIPLNWGDSYLFNGNHYGVPEIVNEIIHRYQNCMGKVETHYRPCECHLCEDWGGCGREGYETVTCSKCSKVFSNGEVSRRRWK